MLRKSNIHNRRSLNLGGAIALSLTIYMVYRLLVKNKMLPFSISSILSSSSHLFNHWHVLAVGLVPVYLGLIIFGTALVSIYCGSAIQSWITRHWPT